MASYMTPEQFAADPGNTEVWGNYDNYMQQWGSQVMGGASPGAPGAQGVLADATPATSRPAGPDYEAWAKGSWNGTPLADVGRGHYDNWLSEYGRAGTEGRNQLLQIHGLNDWHAEGGVAPINGGYGGGLAGGGRQLSLHDRALIRDNMRSAPPGYGVTAGYNSGNMGAGGGGYGPGGSGVGGRLGTVGAYGAGYAGRMGGAGYQSNQQALENEAQGYGGPGAMGGGKAGYDY